MEINKQDKVHHETEDCKYRKVKCHDCGQLQKAVGRVEGSLVEGIKKVDEKVEAVKEINKKMDKKVEAASRQTEKEIGEVKK
jgi:hypothetical protein